MSARARHDDREERLPRWAQQLIAGLRLDLELAERLAEERRLASKPEESDAVVDPYRAAVGLGYGETIRLTPRGLADWQYVDVRCARPDYAGGTPYVEVMAGGTLRVMPRSGNVVRLEVVR